jgi:hypothetical protein
MAEPHRWRQGETIVAASSRPAARPGQGCFSAIVPGVRRPNQQGVWGGDVTGCQLPASYVSCYFSENNWQSVNNTTT